MTVKFEKPVEGTSKGGGSVPPYLAYQTFQNFVASLKAKGGVPGRIDRSVLTQFSGGVQAQLISALRYLGLISPDGIPTLALERLISVEGGERQDFLKEMLHRAYPYIFNETFSLKSATSKQLQDRFETVAGGDTVRKCVSFFILAAKDAGVPMSPYIKAVKAKRGSGARQRKASTNGGSSASTTIYVEKPDTPPATAWSEMLLSKFPSFDPAWPDDVKAKWFDAFDKLMKQGGGAP